MVLSERAVTEAGEEVFGSKFVTQTRIRGQGPLRHLADDQAGWCGVWTKSSGEASVRLPRISGGGGGVRLGTLVRNNLEAPIFKFQPVRK